VPITAAELEARLTADDRDFDRKMRGAEGRVSSFGKTAGVMGRTVARGFALVAGGAIIAGGGMLKLAGEMEQNEIAFATLFGSAKRGHEMLADLAQFAKVTPFEMPGLIDATRRLKAMGFATQDIIPMLTSIGDAASALGVGQEGIDRITTAIGQMAAKGKVSGEEMRQLAEAGIPAWQILADTLGVSVDEAMKKVEARTVDAGTFIAAFQEDTAKRFGGAMQKQSQTLLGLFSTLKDTVRLNLIEMAEPMKEVAREAMPQLTKAISGLLKNVGPVVVKLAGSLAGLFSGLLPVLQPVLAMLSDVLAAVVDALVPILAALGPIIGEVAAAFGEVLFALVPLLPPLGRLLVAILPILPPLISLIALLLRLAGPILNFLINALARVVEFVVSFVTAWRTRWEQVKGIALAVWGFLVDKAIWVRDLVSGAIETLGRWVGNAWEAIIEWFRWARGRIATFVDAMLGPIDELIGALARLLGVFDDVASSGAVRSIGGDIGRALREQGLLSIPEGHQGGEFRASRAGGVGVALLRDGEIVTSPGHEPGSRRVVLEGPVTLVVSGHEFEAYLRGLAREEDDAEGRFRSGVGRMG
jgi:tape measure domain-containing protein